MRFKQTIGYILAFIIFYAVLYFVAVKRIFHAKPEGLLIFCIVVALLLVGRIIRKALSWNS